MSKVIIEVTKALKRLPPRWVCATVVGSILAYRSPELVRELFSGIGVLLNVR